MIPLRIPCLPRLALAPYSSTAAAHLRMSSLRRRASTSPTPPDITATEPKRRRTTPPESPKMSATEAPTLDLTPEEETVRQLLVEVAADIDRTKPEDEEPLTLRFTGGWVRDKLLGGESNDIDVGINKMTGFNFATKLAEFLSKPENQERYNIPPRSIHKVESNPEKSKHLETAMTKILGLDIDLVNLRSETYTADSRIPEMEFGTPVQDALRRDACVNALFYNLHTQRVEDFTERGLDDMKRRLIRTPLAPFETFDDDPLRVLRLIRFASRLDFTIVPEAEEAMKDERIKKALRMKISRERVGKELEKMLRGPHPALALFKFHDLGLFESIFMPALEEPPVLPTYNMARATTCFSYLHTIPEDSSYGILRRLYNTPDDVYIAWIMAALTPWADRTLPGPKKRPAAAAAIAAREGFKADNKLFSTVQAAYTNATAIQSFVDEVATAEVSRGKVGMFIRQLGKDWTNQYLLALLLKAMPYWEQGDMKPKKESEEVFERYARVLKRVDELGLWNVCAEKHVLDGKEFMQALGEKKTGTWMKPALERLMAWQLENPGVGKEEAKAWALEHKEELLRN